MKTTAALLVLAILIGLPAACFAAPAPQEKTFSGIELRIGSGANGKGLAVPLQILALLTILSLVPAILVSVTSFTRIVIVLSLLRQAIGTQSLPPSQVIVGLSLFLTLLVMAPTFERINREAVVPLQAGQIHAQLREVADAGERLATPNPRPTRERFRQC